MRQIMRRTAEMKRPNYKLCQFCGEKVGWEERICTSCGRLTVRNLKSVGMSELLMEDDEICLSVLERQRRSRITFEQVTEAPETGCVAGIGI